MRNVLLFAAMLIVACDTTTDRASDAEAILALSEAFANALTEGDVEALSSLVTEDVVMMPPGAPPVEGMEAARGTFERMFESVTLDEEWTVKEIEIVGDFAYEWSHYTVTITPRGEGDPQREEGQNLFVARRQSDGAWRYARMMWNTDSRTR